MDQNVGTPILLTLVAEIAALFVALSVFGRWMISFVKNNIEDNAKARDELMAELRLQIKKLEKRIAVCEERWMKEIEESKQ